MHTMSNSASSGGGAVQTSDGVRIHYRIVGTGPRTVLFLHGWAGSGSGTFWNLVMEQLGLENVRLVLPDLRGHAHSEHASEGFRTERFGEDMFNLADHLGVTELILVAYSMSGRWAQWMACTRPERVIGQVLIGPAPATPMPLSHELVDDWLRSVRTQEGFRALERGFAKRPLPDDVLGDCFDAVRNTPEHTLRETLRMCTEPSFTHKLSNTRAATVVVGGIHDPLMPPAYLREEVVRHIPGARLALLDCGHSMPLEAPLETAAILEAFLAPLVL